jgi:hypothetical protein
MLIQLGYQDFLHKKKGSNDQFIEGLMPVLTLNNIMEMHVIDDIGKLKLVSYAEYLNVVNAAIKDYIDNK